MKEKDHRWCEEGWNMRLQSYTYQHCTKTPPTGAACVHETENAGSWLHKWANSTVSPRLGGIIPLWETIDSPGLLYKQHPCFVLREDAQLLKSAALLVGVSGQAKRCLFVFRRVPFVLLFSWDVTQQRGCWTLRQSVNDSTRQEMVSLSGALTWSTTPQHVIMHAGVKQAVPRWMCNSRLAHLSSKSREGKQSVSFTHTVYPVPPYLFFTLFSDLPAELLIINTLACNRSGFNNAASRLRLK